MLLLVSTIKCKLSLKTEAEVTWLCGWQLVPLGGEPVIETFLSGARMPHFLKSYHHMAPPRLPRDPGGTVGNDCPQATVQDYSH